MSLSDSARAASTGGQPGHLPAALDQPANAQDDPDTVSTPLPAGAVADAQEAAPGGESPGAASRGDDVAAKRPRLGAN